MSSAPINPQTGNPFTREEMQAKEEQTNKRLQKFLVGLMGVLPPEGENRELELQRKYADKWMYKTLQSKRKEYRFDERWVNAPIFFSQKRYQAALEAEAEERQRDLEKLQATSLFGKKRKGAGAGVGAAKGGAAAKAAAAPNAAPAAGPPALTMYKPIFTIFISVVDCALLAYTIWLNGGFEPWPAVNPFFGPSVQVLLDNGAKYTPYIVERGEWWRLITAMFFHVGIIHLIMNLGMQIPIGKGLERVYGPWRIMTIYILSGIGGNICSSIFVPQQVVVGASSSLYGFFGVLLINVIQSWKQLDRPGFALFSTLMVIIVSLGMGLLPQIDNFAHIGGFVIGLFVSVVLLPNVTFGYWAAKIKIVLVIVFSLITLATFGLGLQVMYNDINPNGWCRECIYLTCIPYANWCDNIRIGK